jgi:chemotaxis protein methyltransferase CheR
MYFSPEMMRAVVGYIARSLAPGGFLFLGHAETLRGLSHDFHLQHSHDTFYYQRRTDVAGDRPLLAAEPSALQTVPTAGTHKERHWFNVIGQTAERIRLLDPAPAKNVRPVVVPIGKWDFGEVLELLRRERFADALRKIRAMPPEAARDPDILLLQAALLVHAGQAAAGAEVALRLLGADEFSAGAHYLLALSCESSGDLLAAMEHDRFAIYLDPAFAMPRLHLGLLAKRAGDTTSARREIGQAILLFEREEPSRLLLFGGGFTREALLALCRAELREPKR